MAQFRFSAAIISRSSGQSVVAAAAYRAGQKLLDERTGDIKDYSRRGGVIDTLILTPQNAPLWLLDRQRLWNQIEHREDRSTRRNQAQLARSLELSLPHELTHEQHVGLLREYFQDEYVELGMVADIAIHAPPKRGDGTNHHAHVLLTMRDIEDDGFGAKNRDWNQKALIEHWRERWAEYQNRALEKYGFEARVDHRSLEDQGLDREPTLHLGPDAQAMEDQGIQTDRGDHNRRVKGANDNLALLKKELAESEKRLAKLRRQRASERMEQIQTTVRAADAVWEKADPRQAPPPEPPPLHPQGPPPYPKTSPPPVPAGGKEASMPDDLSKQQDLAAQQEAERQEKAQADEQARQEKAVKDEADHQQQLRDAQNKRDEEFAKQNAARLAAQAEDMRQARLRVDAQTAERAKLDAAYQAEKNRIAQEDKRRQEAERQARLDEKAKEGPIREASLRYSQALGQHYDIRDPYATLAKSAMAEYAAFCRDREAYDQQIAKTADPIERQALDLRKRIEGADYLAVTGDRIAAQSEIITGRRNSQEALKERQKASDYRIQAQDLRQQLRELRPAPEKEKERERTEPQPARQRRPRSRVPDQYDELTAKVDAEAKEKEKRREKEKDPEREQQQERERELQRKRDRER